ncbi:PhoPQ-regulated protein [Pseudomonas helleri]|uniref:PhoPQ-regulated protein n=2 Tax=Pseudomonas helleri TaxID=1608996 RepID=A0A6G1W2B7_9PSED|nr:PhoPQ-regulated protein [Pseudomonas helleri]MQU16531.1 PhoPQ-regulated protein [Pseudomonas helleri]
MAMHSSFASVLLLIVLLTSGNSFASDAAMDCFINSDQNFNKILSCYKQAHTEESLNYTATDLKKFPGVEKRSFELKSQRWDGHGFVSPAEWTHTIDIYIPEAALNGQALLIANNGINIPATGRPLQTPTDFTEEMALNIARQTHTILISVSNIPNQYLTYSDDDLPRREDDSVAHSWALFLKQPESRPFLSLHIPMMLSLVKAMDLAQQELKPWKIERFIASGASKRGWAAWMTALTDTRVSAIAPFVIDILNTKAVLKHTFNAYGKSWPIAFNAYYREGITQQLDTPDFEKLMQIEDPLLYMETAGDRLTIPKYIVNASSDDFFLPDNSAYFYDALPGEKMLRVAPNSDHYGIQAFVEQSLIGFTNRLQQQRPLPTLNVITNNQQTSTKLDLSFSERPVKLVQWRAHNLNDRDFRLACRVKYEATPIASSDIDTLTVELSTPAQGWSATYIEATMADGLVITTPVVVLPDTYPNWTPTQIEPACKNLSDPT